MELRRFAVLAILVGCGDGAIAPDGGVDDAAVDAATDADIDAGVDADIDAGVAPVIVSPPDGAELRARRQVFEWTGPGSDYRLRIGTTPGAGDLFDSGPLGDATSVVVDGLPLTGATIHAALESGPEGARITSTASYTAPMRRGLAVIVDFADRRLEDWDGLGFQSEADLRVQLDQMEAHWDWLSRGVEKTAWDIARIQLAENLTDDAFPGWIEFREEVARRTREVVDLADYDVDSDGVLDSTWAVVSSGGRAPPYAIGGASQHLGVNIFADGQDSLSVVVHATGNFNHELAHALAVPDLYGQFDTIGDLSLMASSWPLPPNDLGAYERIRLGWVEPVVVDRSTANVTVPSANDNLFAIRIPTARPEEYFLLEYRERPASGFGSAAFPHDGLAVYHVLEGSGQGIDPPHVKLEPADGSSAPGYGAMGTDLAYPENPMLERPWIVRTYFGGDPVVRIENVRRAENAIVVDLGIETPGPVPGGNRIANPSFEAGTEGWTTGGWQPWTATLARVNVGANGTSWSVTMASTEENDVHWMTHVTGLVPGRGHQLCGYLRGDGVTGGRGATLSLAGTFTHTESLYGTFDWTRRCMVVAGAEGAIDAACRLGGFGATTAGTMGCDELSLVELTSAFGP